jgi:prolyl oligopeptidase
MTQRPELFGAALPEVGVMDMLRFHKFTAGRDTDDRVVPGHSFKFAAALQAAHMGDAPVLIRIETRAGHGGGKPTHLKIEEAADLWSFLVDSLDVQLPKRSASRAGGTDSGSQH